MPVTVYKPLANVFCPTGPGGGRDPSCRPGGTKKGGGAKTGSAIGKEKKSPPPPGKSYQPNVEADDNNDGVTDYARVGVPAHVVPPPPRVGKVPNLTPHERKAEKEFMDAFHADPDGMASKFRNLRLSRTKPGDPPTFGTDDAKDLHSAWEGADLSQEQRSINRATLNVALHQTANAITKRAFVQHLDTLKSGDEVMVTVGGVGSGKGFALKNVPEALTLKGKSKAVWDSAGDQNATENPWIQSEAEKRGLKVNYLYVHADPYNSWANPKIGVVKRAADPNDGRMVDSKVFADSYAIGARNHEVFYNTHRNNPNANFMFLENMGTPRQIDGIPRSALKLNRKQLADFAADTAVSSSANAPSHIKRGATLGYRLWPGD